MKKLCLTQNRIALVDDEDFENASIYSWCVGGPKRKQFVHAYIEGKNIKLHRFIMKPKSSKEQIDHINHNIFDNRKSNLRICNNSQNQANKRKYSIKHKELKYKGVSYTDGSKKNPYQAKIRFNKTTYCLGVFPTQELAASAYNIKATELQGEFANINRFKS